MDKRIVSMVTTFHTTDTLPKHVHSKEKGRDGRFHYKKKTIQTPVLVEDYNQHMGGVDHFDQMMQYYPFQRRKVKWTKKITFYYIQTALFNSFSLYKKNTPGGLPLLEFMEEVLYNFINFNTREWPASGITIHHVTDLPPGEYQPPLGKKRR